MQLFQGDCLTIIEQIPDKSIDMILCDLPYNITKNNWDSVIPIEDLWAEYQRIIKDNGCIALFGSWNTQQAVDKQTNYGHYKQNIAQSDGKRLPTTLIHFNRIEHPFHPTQKPVELLEWLIKTYTNEGDLVLDNCTGSGSCGVACVNTHRNFFGIELKEDYFEYAQNWIEAAQKSLTKRPRKNAG